MKSSDAKAVLEKDLLKTLKGLFQIVEGVQSSRWANENGTRLKDTLEWVRFYLAYKALQKYKG